MIMFALASVFIWFALFMVALARVFLDPRLFSTSPRIVNLGAAGGGAAQTYTHTNIPEPVAPVYEPQEYQPQEYEAPKYQDPSYQAHAYHEQAYQTAQGEQYAAPQQAYYSSDPAAEVGYVEPAQPSDPYANPYATQTQAQNGDMNVLGTLPPNGT